MCSPLFPTMRLLLVFRLILAFAPILAALPLEQLDDEENNTPNFLGAGSSELFSLSSTSSSFDGVASLSDELDDNNNMFLEEDPSEGNELFQRLSFLSCDCLIDHV